MIQKTTKHLNDSNSKELNREEPPSSSPTHKAALLLAESVEKLMNSESYKAALSFRKKLYAYSFRNVWLIYCQLPTASMICGYKKWQDLGRQVKKGEKSIVILAPLIKKDKDTEEKEIFGFKTSNVFDISQTEGEPIPEMPRPKLLEGDSEQIQTAIKQLESFASERGNPVSYQALKANGVYSLKTKAILINETLEPFQRLKTLIHELAHALLHDQITTEPSHRLELEAESCAFLTCDALGLDTSQYSFAYLANWAEDAKELLSAAEKACKAADTLLELIELGEGLSFGSEKTKDQYHHILSYRPELAKAINDELKQMAEPIFMGHLEAALIKLLPDHEGKRIFNHCWRLGEKAYLEAA